MAEAKSDCVPGETCKETKNMGVTLHVSSYLMLEIAPDDPTFAGEIAFDDFIPEPNGAFQYKSVIARVQTSQNSGYQLSLNDLDNNTSMDNEDPEVNSSLRSITSPVTVAQDGNNFPANQWGYLVGNFSEMESGQFLPIPPLSSPVVINSRNTPNLEGFDDTPVTFAIKPSSMLAPGEYSDVLQFTATAVLQPEFTPYEPIVAITYMQDMQSSICNAIPTPSPSAKVSSPDINRINNSIDSNTGLAGLVPEIYLKDKRDEKEYKIRKLADGNCWMVENLKYELKSGQTVPADKTDIARDWTPATVKTSGKWGANDGTIAMVTNNPTTAYANEYYYTWFAATAGTGTKSMTSASVTNLIDAPGSICPKGWRLPQGGAKASDNGANSNKSWFNLFKAYGKTAAASNGSTFSGGISYLNNDPFNIIPAGFYNYSNGSLYGADSYAYYWSSSAYTSQASVYDLYADSSAVYPGTNSLYKGSGFSIRCVAR